MEEQTEAQKCKEFSRVTKSFPESATDRPGLELRQGTKHLDSECTILALLRAASWNLTGIS